MKVRTVIAIAAVVPLLSVGVALLPGVASERWEEMVAWVQRAEKGWRERSFDRAPVWGAVEAGSAFAAYADALAQSAVLGRGDTHVAADLRLRPELVAAEQAEAFALRWGGALAAMTAGAHRSDARPAIDWQKGVQQASTSLLAGRDLVNAAAVEARRRIAAGDQAGGVGLLLDAATFAVDLQQSPLVVDRLVACALLQIAVQEALRDADLASLGEAALRQLEAGLAALDARWRATFDGSGEALLLARTLVGEAAGGEPPAEGAPAAAAPRTWRYGWSRRWAAADAVMLMVTAYEGLDRDDALPWPQREPRLRAVEGELQAQANAMVRAFAPSPLSVEVACRRAAVHLRLLRLAAAVRRGTDAPQLVDPFGAGELQVVRRDDGALLRSAGVDADHPIERFVPAR